MATIYTVCVDGAAESTNLVMTAVVGSEGSRTYYDINGCLVNEDTVDYRITSSNPSDNPFRCHYSYFHLHEENSIANPPAAVQVFRWFTYPAQASAFILQDALTYVVTRCNEEPVGGGGIDQFAEAQ